MAQNKLRKRPAFFSISAVAKMFDIHQQTIRLYEKEGFISPQRTDGNTRMFSEEDIEKLEEILHLTHQLGINLAGVDMVLKLQRKIKRMQKDMNKIFANAQSELTQETDVRKAVIQTQMQQLMKIKKTIDIPSQDDHNHQDDNQNNQSKFKDWDIDYEE